MISTTKGQGMDWIQKREEQDRFPYSAGNKKTPLFNQVTQIPVMLPADEGDRCIPLPKHPCEGKTSLDMPDPDCGGGIGSDSDDHFS